MTWPLRRAGGDPRREWSADLAPPGRAAPGLGALFDGLGIEGGHSVLDLGAASDGSLRRYGRFARRIRFADVLVSTPPGVSVATAVGAVPRDADHPYDVVVAWNVLDRVESEQRPLVVEQLVQLSTPGARLYLLTDMSEERAAPAQRFTILEDDRVQQKAGGAPEPMGRPVLPREVERLLMPFRVVHAFVLRAGMREYVAVR